MSTAVLCPCIDMEISPESVVSALPDTNLVITQQVQVACLRSLQQLLIVTSCAMTVVRQTLAGHN